MAPRASAVDPSVESDSGMPAGGISIEFIIIIVMGVVIVLAGTVIWRQRRNRSPNTSPSEPDPDQASYEPALTLNPGYQPTLPERMQHRTYAEIEDQPARGQPVYAEVQTSGGDGNYVYYNVPLDGTQQTYDETSSA